MNIEQLYKKYYVQLYKFALKLTGCENVSNDLVQDVFVKAYDKRKILSSIENIRAWLYKILYNDFKNQYKRVKTFERIISEIEDEPLIVDTEKLYDKNEIRSIVKKAIESFPERDRSMLLLYYNGLSYAEIADVLEMNPNSVGKTLARNISKLTSNLKIQYHELFV